MALPSVAAKYGPAHRDGWSVAHDEQDDTAR